MPISFSGVPLTLGRARVTVRHIGGPAAAPRPFSFTVPSLSVPPNLCHPKSMDLKLVPLELPEGANLILGQSHFIKTIEDIYEAIVNTVPQMKFGVAFNEASGPCLTRADGNDDALTALAIRHASALAAGHTFVVVMRDGYPINVLTRIKDVPEVCGIFCATANAVQVVVAESDQGRGILGVIDGESPKGVETPEDVEKRRGFLRMIGYKR
jgi:uncharacterized protein